MTIRFFESKVFTVIFLCLLTNLSIPKASAATARILEYDTSNGGSELHSQGSHKFRWIKCSIEGIEGNVPIYDSVNLSHTESDIVGYLHSGDRVTLAQDTISDYFRIIQSQDQSGNTFDFTNRSAYVNGSELAEIQRTIEECNRIVSQSRERNQYKNEVLGSSRINAEIPIHLYEKPGFSGNKPVTIGNSSTPIELMPGEEITVINENIFHPEGGIIESTEDAIKHGWLRVSVMRFGKPYVGYIRYQDVYSRRPGNSASSN